jgi:hydrogenase expression/formation protein HypE
MDETHIQLAHGGGGQLTAELIGQVILPALGAVSSQDGTQLSDAAVIDLAARVGAGGTPATLMGGTPMPRLAFTTDSYVVQPLEFPGGDIGKLAICGTVNDLSVVGARPMAISLALVLEEGLEIALLARVLGSAAVAAAGAGVKIATGDTKVVERGGLSGMIINTAGIGLVYPQASLGLAKVRSGDQIILSGPLGEHGLAVMSMRKGLSFRTELLSDCAALDAMCGELVGELGGDLRFMRDPTRGGLAATLVELAQGSGHDIEINESAIPVNRAARSAAEILGLDLLTVANEGKLVAVASPGQAQAALEIMRRHVASPACPARGVGSRAAIIGSVGARAPQGGPIVEMVTSVGGRRIVQMPYGEELPRIC